VKDFVCAGTGHRPSKLGGYGQEVFKGLVGLALSAIHSRGYTRIISGMALGWDQALAAAAIQLKIPFIAAVPCHNYHVKWPNSSVSQYQSLLKQCSEVVIVTHAPYQPHYLQLRNQWMVDRADEILALFDGEKQGGTWNCIRYAMEKGKPIHNLWSQALPLN
jgi:uncharacterized phage-like protein YoqJ